MAIIIVAGDPGNGKGVFAMQLLEDACLSGRPVYTNIQLLKGCPYRNRVALIDDPKGEWPVYRGTPARDGKKSSDDYMAFWHYVCPGGIVVLDEADAYFDCTDHSAVGHDIRLFHKQHRKLKLDLIYIVQNLQNLYIRIRRLAQRFILCEWNWRSQRFFQSTLAPWIGIERAMGMTRFLRSDFRSEIFSPMTHMSDGFITYPEAKQKFFLDPWYETEQLIGDISHIRYKQFMTKGPVLDGNGEPPDDVAADGAGRPGGGGLLPGGSRPESECQAG